MTQINTTTYIIDAVRSIENGFTEVQELLDKLFAHDVKDKKIAYAKTVSSLEYTRGMINGIALVINNITNSNSPEKLTIENMFEHWNEEYADIEKSIIEYKKTFFWTENTIYKSENSEK